MYCATLLPGMIIDRVVPSQIIPPVAFLLGLNFSCLSSKVIRLSIKALLPSISRLLGFSRHTCSMFIPFFKKIVSCRMLMYR